MKTIEMHCIINATPEEVFRAMTNAFTVELWSGYPARIEPTENTEFSIFDGDITGRNLKITPGEQLVQEWYFGDQAEQSVVTIKLTPQRNTTRVHLKQTNIPDVDYGEIENGWKKYYWAGIKDFFK